MRTDIKTKCFQLVHCSFLSEAWLHSFKRAPWRYLCERLSPQQNRGPSLCSPPPPSPSLSSSEFSLVLTGLAKRLLVHHHHHRSFASSFSRTMWATRRRPAEVTHIGSRQLAAGPVGLQYRLQAVVLTA